MTQQVAIPAEDRKLYVLVASAAVAAWLVPWLLLDGKEAWDHWSYFLVAIPVMTIVAAYAGYSAKTGAWRWPLVLIAGQAVTLLLLEGLGNLFPLGLVVFVIFAIPMMIAAVIGAWLSRRAQS